MENQTMYPFIDELIETLNSKIKVLEELNSLKDSRIQQLEENLLSTEEMLKKGLVLINEYQEIVKKITDDQSIRKAMSDIVEYKTGQYEAE